MRKVFGPQLRLYAHNVGIKRGSVTGPQRSTSWGAKQRREGLKRER